MMRRALSALLALFAAIATSAVWAQNKTQPSPKTIQLVSGKATAQTFQDGKTIVAKILFDGLDGGEEMYGFAMDDSLSEETFLRHYLDKSLRISEGEKLNTSKVGNVIAQLKKWLADNGYLKADVIALGTKLSGNKMRLLFSVDRGVQLDPPELHFTGSSRIAEQEFIDDFKICSGDNWKPYEFERFDYYGQQCSKKLLHSRGFLRAKVLGPNAKLVDNRYIVTFVITDGPRYLWGDFKIEGAKQFSAEKIMDMFGQKTGDVADARFLRDFVYERLKREYDEIGYVQYSSEFEPEFVDAKEEGLDGSVNIKILIDEGRQYKISWIDFSGIEDQAEKRSLTEALPLKLGDIFVRSKFETGIENINKLGTYLPADKDQDVELRVDEKSANINLVIKLRKNN